MLAMHERIRANTWGRYYVTDACDACGMCASLAPFNFTRSWDGSYYAVCDQPQDEAEEQAVRAAMAACPLKCIQDDWEG